MFYYLEERLKEMILLIFSTYLTISCTTIPCTTFNIANKRFKQIPESLIQIVDIKCLKEFKIYAKSNSNALN